MCCVFLYLSGSLKIRRFFSSTDLVSHFSFLKVVFVSSNLILEGLVSSSFLSGVDLTRGMETVSRALMASVVIRRRISVILMIRPLLMSHPHRRNRRALMTLKQRWIFFKTCNKRNQRLLRPRLTPCEMYSRFVCYLCNWRWPNSRTKRRPSRRLRRKGRILGLEAPNCFSGGEGENSAELSTLV